MATGGEVPGRLPDSARSEYLSQRICQPCLEKDSLIHATGLCVDCQDYLCLKCFDDHKEQQHRVLVREQMLHGQTRANQEDSCSDSCSVHENEFIQYYCASHCHLGCKSCINLDHPICDEVHNIPHVSKDLVNNEDYKQVETRLKSVLDTFMNAFRNAQRHSNDVDKSCTDALRDLHAFRKQMDEVLENIESGLIAQLKSLRVKTEQRLAGMKYKFKAAHEELQSLLAKIEYLQNTNQNCSSYIEMMRTKEKIQSMEDQTQQVEVDLSQRQRPIRFTPNSELLEILRNSRGFGTVSSYGTRSVSSGSDEVTMLSDINTGSVISGSDDITILSHSETLASFSDDFTVITDPESGAIQAWLRTVPTLPGSNTDDIVSDSAFVTKDYHFQDLNVRTELDNSGFQITGMTVLPDSRLVLTDYKTGSIKAVDLPTGQVVAQRELTSRPWDIASLGGNEVAVTMPYEKQIAFLTFGDNNLSFGRKLTVGGKCLGVDYRNGKLAVSYINPHIVEILNLKGRVLHIIKNRKSGKTLLNYPFYLAFGQDDTMLYVSNSIGHHVLCVKVDGNVVAIYRDKHLRYPRKAVVDSKGNLYVCDQGSNKVHKIKQGCKELQVLLTQAHGLVRPLSICLSEEGDTFYIGMSRSDYVKVYRIGCNQSQ